MRNIDSAEPHDAWQEILAHRFDREPELARNFRRTSYVAWGMFLLHRVSSGVWDPARCVMAMTVLASAGLRAVEDGLLSMQRLREINPESVQLPQDLKEWLDALGGLDQSGAPDVPEA